MRKFIDLHLHLDGSVPLLQLKVNEEHNMPALSDEELRQSFRWF